MHQVDNAAIDPDSQTNLPVAVENKLVAFTIVRSSSAVKCSHEI